MKKVKKPKTVTHRDPHAYSMAVRTGSGGGKHKNRTRDLNRGSSRKTKHKNQKNW